MRVLVCGGRNHPDAQSVYRALDETHRKGRITLVIEGGAQGADCFARNWATAWRIAGETYIADWETHGRAAGPIRNQRMIDEGKPDLVIAFPGGTGTADMVRRAKAAGIPVQEVPPPPASQWRG